MILLFRLPRSEWNSRRCNINFEIFLIRFVNRMLLSIGITAIGLMFLHKSLSDLGGVFWVTVTVCNAMFCAMEK